MAKSTGNISTLSEIGKTPADIKAFRYLVVATHYRTALNFSEEVLDAAKNTLRRLLNVLDRLQAVDGTEHSVSVAESIDRTRTQFIEHMDDDLNAARAVADIFELVREAEDWLMEEALNRETAKVLYDFFEELNQVLGIFYELPEEDGEVTLTDKTMELIRQREEARRRRDWGAADQLREELLEQGVVVKDTQNGTEWELTNN